jgi:hypothetical protein
LFVSAVVVPPLGFVPAVEVVPPDKLWALAFVLEEFKVVPRARITWASFRTATDAANAAAAAFSSCSVYVSEAHAARPGVNRHWAAVGTALQPGSEESEVHWATVGSTAEQPASDEFAVHAASVGNTAEQPPNEELVVHCARVGSTTEQPAIEELVVHWASVGSTAEQPVSEELAVH